MKSFAAILLGSVVLAQQRFLSDDDEQANQMRKMCFTDDSTDCVLVPVSSDVAKDPVATSNGELAWRDDSERPVLLQEQEEQQSELDYKLLCFNADDPTDCVRVPKSSAATTQRGDRDDELAWQDKKDQPLLMGGDGTIKALDQEGHPMVKNDEGSLDWRSQEDHPMVKDGSTNSNSGSLDWKSQEDHPIVKDDEKDQNGDLDWKNQEDHPMVKDSDPNKSSSTSGDLDWKSQDDHPIVKDNEGQSISGDGSIDWKSQDDHPMVKDDDKDWNGDLDWKKQGDHPMVKDDEENKPTKSLEELWNDMFHTDHAQPLSIGISFIAASVLAAQI